MPEYDFVVLGHSHAIAFLDGVTDWRQHSAPNTSTPKDPRYSEAYQGWRSGAFPAEVLAVNVTEPGLRSRRLLARLISRTSSFKTGVEFVERDGRTKLQIQPQFLDVLRELPANTPIVSFMHGNEHARMMLGHLPPYDFIDPEVADINPSSDAVPIDTMFIDQVIDAWLAVVAPTLTAIKAITGSRVIHVLPPAPVENPQSSSYLEKLEAFVLEYGFAPDPIRLKWYRRYCRLLSMVLEANGCEVLPPPANTVTREGFLKSSLSGGLTHGSSEYGKHIARALEEKIWSGKS